VPSSPLDGDIERPHPHLGQISEDRVDKIKDVLKIGQEIEARVIKVDKAERRIGLSLKGCELQRRRHQARKAAAFDALKPGEDMVGPRAGLRRRRGRVSPRRLEEEVIQGRELRSFAQQLKALPGKPAAPFVFFE